MGRGYWGFLCDVDVGRIRNGKNKWQHLSDKRITSLLVGSTYVTAEGGILWQKSRYDSSVKIRMPKMSVERIEQIGK